MQADELRRIVGANVRRRRLALDMTQQKLAEQLGVAQSYISGLERGDRSPLLATLAEFAEVLQTQPAQLLTPLAVAAA